MITFNGIQLSLASSEYLPKLQNIFSEDADFVFTHNSNCITIFRILHNIRTHNIRLTSTSYSQNTIYIEQHNSTKQCLVVFKDNNDLLKFIAINCAMYFDFFVEQTKFKKLYYTAGDCYIDNAVIIKKHVNSILIL